MESLDEIRQKKLRELQESQVAEQEEDQSEERAFVLRQIMTPEAKERLGRLKIARPDFATELENQLIMLVQTGRVQERIDDEMLKMLLAKLQPQKREISIKRR